MAQSILTGFFHQQNFVYVCYMLHILIVVQAIKMSESLMKRTPLTDDIQVPESNMTDPLTKEEEAFRRVGGQNKV